MKSPARLCAVVFTLLLSGVCVAQVSGRFTTEKVTYAVGEPVYLDFTMRNDSTKPLYVDTADPYSFCSGYDVHVIRNATPAPACYLLGFGGSCPSSNLLLAPGASRTERILLNYSNRSHGNREPTVRVAGDYTVQAKRDLSFTLQEDIQSPRQQRTFSQELYVRVDPEQALPQQAFEPYVAQLQSQDFALREQAALALATLAPIDLEPLLLTFAASKDLTIQQAAPDALANLNTPKSLDALAEMVKHEEPGGYASARAAELLGEKHDAKWFPLLLAVADQNAGLSGFYQAAGKAGGALAVSTFAARLRGAGESQRMVLLYALAETGSVSAIPLLIDALPTQSATPDDEIRRTAWQVNMLLSQLTHRTAIPDYGSFEVQDLRGRWQRWWLANAHDATAYFAEDCGPVEVIP